MASSIKREIAALKKQLDRQAPQKSPIAFRMTPVLKSKPEDSRQLDRLQRQLDSIPRPQAKILFSIRTSSQCVVVDFKANTVTDVSGVAVSIDDFVANYR